MPQTGSIVEPLVVSGSGFSDLVDLCSGELLAPCCMFRALTSLCGLVRIRHLTLPTRSSSPYCVNQRTIFLVTRSAASQCTQWAALGTVIRVRSLSTHSHVSFSAPGKRAQSFRP